MPKIRENSFQENMEKSTIIKGPTESKLSCMTPMMESKCNTNPIMELQSTPALGGKEDVGETVSSIDNILPKNPLELCVEPNIYNSN